MSERGRPSQRYRVLDRMGVVVAEGTPKECAEQMDRNVAYVHRIINGQNSYPEHWAFPLPSPVVAPTPDTTELIKIWDDFTTPLREEFGIPRYVPKEEKK